MGDIQLGRRRSSSEFVEIVKTVVYALLIALVIRVLLFQPFTIPTSSMEPGLATGDYILVSKWTYGWSRASLPFNPPLPAGRIGGRAPRHGEVIVFRLPREPAVAYVKRLIGLPGDRIQVRGGVVYINGKGVPRDEMTPTSERTPFGFNRAVERYKETLPNGRSYVTYSYGSDGDVDNTGVYVVPQGHYFMMGDNRDNSQDSRFSEAVGVGFVPFENLVGRADLILLSWNDQASLLKPWTWFIDARPSRFAHLLK